MSNPTITNYIIIEGVFADGKHLISAELTEATPRRGRPAKFRAKSSAPFGRCSREPGL